MRLATLDDKARVEEIVNDPRLRSWYAEEGAPPCDAARYLAAPSFTVIGEEGCFLAHAEGDRHVVHTNLLPAWRGAKALDAARRALAVAFLETPCTELVSMVPDSIPQAMWLARPMGMRTLFRREGCWHWRGRAYGMTFVSLAIDDWILSGACRAAGVSFHDRLPQVSHAPEDVHDSYVGAAFEMVRRGQVEKAVTVYNRWARFAMFETIAVIGENPLRIDIRDCVLRVEEGDFSVEAKHA